MMFDGVSTFGITASIGAVTPSPCEEDSRSKKASNNKVKFTDEEDKKLKSFVEKFGTKDWIHISNLMETRNPRQCRERWNNYVNPALRNDPWTPEEDLLLDAKYAEYGPSWNKISKFFINRSDNSIRNRWMMIARHRSKHVKNPMSPAPNLRTEPHPVVMPVVKEIREVEKRPNENSFELLTLPQFTLPTNDSFDHVEDFWNDFSFF